jgi:hypothetical protein
MENFGPRSPFMLAKPLLNHVLEDEALTRGLEDPEARILVEWLVENVERLASEAPTEAAGWGELERLCRRARAIARFIGLWCQGERGAAMQLAAVERFQWPLPTRAIDPCEFMKSILNLEILEVTA